MTSRFDALFEIGRYEEALRVAIEERAREPGSYEAAGDVALALTRLERWQDGLRAAAEAVALDPEGELGHRIGAICLSNLGRHDEAISAATEAVRIFPGAPEPWLTLFEAYDEAGRPEESLRVAHHLVTEFPGDAASHLAMGLVGLRRQQWRLAERALRIALSIEPGNVQALHNLAGALDAQGRRRDAVELLSHAVRADPAEELSREALGSVATGFALRAGIAAGIVMGVVPALLLRGSDDESLAGTLFLVACCLGYSVYRAVGAARLAGLPAPARAAAVPVLRRRDRFVFGLMAALFGSYTSLAVGDGRWSTAAVGGVATAVSLVWALDGRWRLPRFAGAIDRMSRRWHRPGG